MAKLPETNRPAGSERGVTDDLGARIASAQRARAAETQAQAARASGTTSGASRAIRLGSEFVAAVLVGLGIGFVLDQLLGTRPWLMLVMLLVGFAAGVLNITRAAREMNSASPPPPGSDLGPEDDDNDA